MEWILLLVVTISIISAILESLNHEAERYAFDLDEESGSFNAINPLSDIRSFYSKQLEKYYENNKPKLYLVNDYCEARLVLDKKNTYFYVKERLTEILNGRYFEVKGDLNHVNTMWAIIDMEFNEFKTYGDIKDLYYTLNQTENTTGGLKHFNESFSDKLPKPIKNKRAQNEYCRMEIESLHGKTVIVCSEIWGTPNYNKPQKFIIQSDKYTLYKIVNSFAKKIYKRQNYNELFSEYLMLENCNVLTFEEFENKLNNEITENKIQKPEPQEHKIEPAENLQINKNDTEKYNERNLDL